MGAQTHTHLLSPSGCHTLGVKHWVSNTGLCKYKDKMNFQLNTFVRTLFAKLFSVIFLGLALAIIVSLVMSMVSSIAAGKDFMEVFLSSINTGIIALAVFELALIINKEYSRNHSTRENAIESLRRTLPTFIGTVCVALSLEGLIMVIKYSQLELAGNLYYPVAIITSTAFLLIALAVFIKLTEKPTVVNQA